MKLPTVENTRDILPYWKILRRWDTSARISPLKSDLEATLHWRTNPDLPFCINCAALRQFLPDSGRTSPTPVYSVSVYIYPGIKTPVRK